MLCSVAFAAVLVVAAGKPLGVTVYSDCEDTVVNYCPVLVVSDAGELCCRAKVQTSRHVALRKCTASSRGALVLPIASTTCPFLRVAAGKTWCCIA